MIFKGACINCSALLFKFFTTYKKLASFLNGDKLRTTIDTGVSFRRVTQEARADNSKGSEMAHANSEWGRDARPTVPSTTW